MEYEKIYPKSSIRHLVHFFWNFEGDFTETSLYSHSSVACVYPKLAFQYIPGMMIMENGESKKLFVSGVQSQTNAYYELSSSKKAGIFGVYLQPYAIPILFNIPADEMTNQNIEITELCGKEGLFLEEQILNCRSTQERIETITYFIEKRVSDLPFNLQMMMNAIHHLIMNNGNIKMPELLADHFLSQRQFERNFKTLTGFSPKYFSRIIRFEKSITAAYHNQQLSLTELALHSGYFDQAHMIRDFREFSGKKPSAYFSQDQSLFVIE
ncbi:MULTISPECIES: helix-turn-helix domain-containing protein [Chryseobacterium]|uniref:AraC-like DNA-binding protein n=1 Tax=Chryseobacterium camelliae TaxID=1265445 RepID=A0ABU0TGP4_9FLAO|nr:MULTISPECIES: helix-turn-helix domain-containing protein [Chryseobacterium]MDQ1095986.1 AraC-like DNA-binding protein [Chryseobacterium camelliae]MDR6087268.1 AraC-like DNA-binding protein [Chryseobacterium sp. SORGH_AS_0909]MDR6131642.1 AraC-like DNA-binding protein [Chryseobacterium sp. SORGH_AS_1175]MDT3406213.1 AraC-like DNA-binding protein [Pseudacidovorax intermedius]